jgi:hypothetical protein
VIDDTTVKPLVDKANSSLYKATINVYNKRYSGLIVLKQTDATTSHLTFITEIGMKMFDFEIKKDTFRLVYVFEPLNKPKILNLLENDMKLVLFYHLLNKKAETYKRGKDVILKTRDSNYYYYKLNTGKNTIKKTVVKGKLFKKCKVDYFYGDSLDVQQIRLKHTGLIRVKIDLNKITKQVQQ